MGGLIGFGILLLIYLFIVWIPIRIAKSKNLKGTLYLIIVVLSWCLFIGGFPWLIALVLSLFSSANLITDKKDDLDKLQQLYDLKEKGVISEVEYQNQRHKILKN